MHSSSSPSLARMVGLVAALGTGLLACGERETVQPPPATEFTLTLAPASLSIRQGEAGTVNAQVTITAGPATSITLTPEGAPTGVTVSAPTAATPIAAGGNAVLTLAVQAGPTATLGNAGVTVKARSASGVEKSATFSLTILPPPSYALAVTPTTQTINQGAAGGAVVTVARTGFDAPVLLAVEGAPLGVSGIFTPPTVTGTTAALEILVASTVAVGTYPITIRGTAAGLTDRTITFTLTVNAAPNFSIAVKTPSRTVTSGTSVTDSVFITRANFPDGVSLSLDAPNAGITGTFNPGATTGASSVLTLNVAPTVAPGAYVLTVRATAGAAGERTAQINLVVVAPAPDIALALTPQVLVVQAGQSGSSAVAITRTNFTANVTLSVDTPPAGITASFVPGVTSGTTSTLTIAVATAVTPGDYNLTVRGTGAGITARTTTLALTVTPPPTLISLAASPESVTVFQNATATTSLTIARTNFTGPVTLTAGGAPNGMSVAFAQNPVAGNATTMSITPSAGVAAGRYALTLTASGVGVSDAPRTFVVQVVANTAGAVQFSFCDPARVPVFFAYQDSTGVWTGVTPSSAGNVSRYTFDIVSDRGAVAFITRQTTSTPRVASLYSPARSSGQASVLTRAHTLLTRSQAVRDATRNRGSNYRAAASSQLVDVYETTVYYLSRTEMLAVGQEQCGGVLSTKTNLVPVSGVPTGQTATISLGGVTRTFTGGTTTSPVTFTGVPNRTIDLVATRVSPVDGFDRGVILRDLNPPAGSTVSPTVDFDAASAFRPATATANINGSFGHSVLLNSFFFTANGEAGLFAVDGAPSVSTSRLWAGVPGSHFVNSDIHGLFVLATPPGSPVNEFRTLLQYTGAVANQTLQMATVMNPVTVVPVGAGLFRFTSQLPTGLQQGLDIFFSSTAGSNTLRLVATQNFLRNMGQFPSFDITSPNLTTVTGYPTAAKLTSGSNDIRISGLGWTGNGITTARVQSGDQLRTGSVGMQVVVP